MGGFATFVSRKFEPKETNISWAKTKMSKAQKREANFRMKREVKYSEYKHKKIFFLKGQNCLKLLLLFNRYLVIGIVLGSEDICKMSPSYGKLNFKIRESG